VVLPLPNFPVRPEASHPPECIRYFRLPPLRHRLHRHQNSRSVGLLLWYDDDDVMLVVMVMVVVVVVVVMMVVVVVVVIVVVWRARRTHSRNVLHPRSPYPGKKSQQERRSDFKRLLCCTHFIATNG
jgi:hypothetical protein